MKKIGLVLLTSILIPIAYEGRKYYIYSKMVNNYKKNNNRSNLSFGRRFFKSFYKMS